MEEDREHLCLRKIIHVHEKPYLYVSIAIFHEFIMSLVSSCCFSMTMPTFSLVITKRVLVLVIVN